MVLCLEPHGEGSGPLPEEGTCPSSSFWEGGSEEDAVDTPVPLSHQLSTGAVAGPGKAKSC